MNSPKSKEKRYKRGGTYRGDRLLILQGHTTYYTTFKRLW